MKARSNGIRILATLFSAIAVGLPASAEIFVYTDQTLYLADAAALGYCLVHEGFEDDAAWGSARSPNTVSSVTTMGVTWLPNNGNSELTTGAGAARTGLWGFYELPHGNPSSGVNDGWIGQTKLTFRGVGGWIRTNTPFAAVDMVLDDTTVVDFDPSTVGTSHSFFGVLETLGFTKWEVRELEGKPGDQKFIFSDDFSLAFDEPCGSTIFADGFESGDTSAWSTTVP